MLPSVVSVSLQRDFLCIIRTIARRRLRAQKGPLYDYACVANEGLCYISEGIIVAP